jgi:AhpD family alkylhydroperoxidase
MTEFTKHTADSAQEEARPVLEGVQKGLGFAPNLIAYMADAPALAQGYTTLSGIFEKQVFHPLNGRSVLLTVSRENSCRYCMAGHTSIAQMQKVPSDVIRALRDGAIIQDSKREALRAFTETLVDRRGYAE